MLEVAASAHCTVLNQLVVYTWTGLRSADSADYVKDHLQSKFGERCFSYAGPAAWNSLPHSIMQAHHGH